MCLVFPLGVSQAEMTEVTWTGPKDSARRSKQLSQGRGRSETPTHAKQGFTQASEAMENFLPLQKVGNVRNILFIREKIPSNIPSSSILVLKKVCQDIQ